MGYKTLALILAAGEGSRVKHLLEKDEPVKAMINVGKNRLIDLALNSLEDLDAERAVLSFPSEEYEDLDRRVKEYSNVRLLKQMAKHRKLPYLLELPYILVMQCLFSDDKSYLHQFDSILTMPCDLVLNNVNLEAMLNFHYSHLEDPNQRQLTLLSRLGTDSGKSELFRMDGDKIIKRKKCKGVPVEGYEISTQAGVYIFSKGILKNPLRAIATLVWDNKIDHFRHIKLLRYLTEGTWTNYGNPDNLKMLRAENTPL